MVSVEVVQAHEDALHEVDDHQPAGDADGHGHGEPPVGPPARRVAGASIGHRMAAYEADRRQGRTHGRR